MHYRTILLGFALSFALTFTCLAQDFSSIEKLVRHAKEVSGLPSGTAIAVIKGNQIIYENYFGYTDIAARKPVDQTTAFYIGSVTKPIFALSALLLEDKGKLTTDQSLTDMFPTYKFPGISAASITVKDLLGHTSGLDYEAFILATAYTGLHNSDTRHQLIRTLQPKSRQEPGEFAYTNGGYNVLSVWYDDAYAKSWQNTLAETIFKPLRLSRTSAYISNARIKGYEIAKTYSFARGDRSAIQKPLYLAKKDNTMHAAGGVTTTAHELARIIIAELNEGQVDGEQIFPAHVIEKSQGQLTTTNESYGIPNATGYAWGWAIGDYKGHRLYSHGGGFAGVNAHASFMPEQGFGLVILNAEDAVSASLSRAVQDITYDILLGAGDIDAKAKNAMDGLSKRIPRLHDLYESHYQQLAHREMKLSLDKSQYVGTYTHHLLGTVSIELNDTGKFEVTFGNMKSLATAYKTPDALRVELNPGRGEGLTFKFSDDVITGISVWGFDFSKDISPERNISP